MVLLYADIGTVVNLFNKRLKMVGFFFKKKIPSHNIQYIFHHIQFFNNVRIKDDCPVVLH